MRVLCPDHANSYVEKDAGRSALVSFPDLPVLCAKEGLVYKVGILGCADSAVVGKLRNKT